jgi:hypothetical protein
MVPFFFKFCWLWRLLVRFKHLRSHFASSTQKSLLNFRKPDKKSFFDCLNLIFSFLISLFSKSFFRNSHSFIEYMKTKP